MRDRWMEVVNSDEYQAALSPVNAKYDVGRLVESSVQTKLLEVLPVAVKRVA